MEKHNVILAKLKSEVVQAHDEVLKLKGAVPKVMRHLKAFFFCKQYGYVKMQDETASSFEEKWFVYGPEKKEEVDKYIHSR
ncbi:hypothetical protein DEO72_LG5g1319 [Vigna unguiculata]|uniref:Uncharacterized protein n=1 Tax=Vigna unguiculata TaxID=3917 RepID=A0A4D6LX43_VIGUN|nr:hypothetical protein DEO72_LG5g1319 [Vigna unguiculata]